MGYGVNDGDDNSTNSMRIQLAGFLAVILD